MPRLHLTAKKIRMAESGSQAFGCLELPKVIPIHVQPGVASTGYGHVLEIGSQIHLLGHLPSELFTQSWSHLEKLRLFEEPAPAPNLRNVCAGEPLVSNKQTKKGGSELLEH